MSGFGKLIVCLVATLAGALGTVPAVAETGSPKAFLDGIYRSYLGKVSKGIPLSDASVIRRYFAPPLADAIVKDMADANKRGEVPALNGDPFIDAQDWEIANLAIAVKAAATDKAVATVSFTNFRERRTISLDLVRTGAGWRIAEIRAPSGSLRELYKLK
jgi:hypothetical protein